MKRQKPPYVQEFIDEDGTPRFYLRKPGVKRIPLPGLPWSPEFMAAYEAGLGISALPEIGAARTKPGSVNAAIVSYFNKSADFKGMKLSTQKMRRAILERFRNDHGDRNIATLDERALKAILAKLSPLAALNWLKTLRSLLRHAIDVNLRKDDPSANIKLRTPKSDGHHSWSEEEIVAFQNRHPIGSRARLALALLLYTGQRRGDAVRMGRQHVTVVDGEHILSITQEKTGNHVAIPVLDPIWEALNAMPKSSQLAFLVTAKGKQFTSAGFGNWFRECCDEAGLPHCSAHGLRKAAATRMAENGATTHQLMSWFGWTSVSEAERYTKKADRARMNLTSGSKLISRTEIVKPETQFDKTTSKSLKS
jgi:integrase